MNPRVQGQRSDTAFAEGVFSFNAACPTPTPSCGALPVAPVPADTKTELRRRLRAARRALDRVTRRRAAVQLAWQLARTRAFRASRRIACYLPVDGEIDTAVVLARSARLRKRCYLPVLSRIARDRLWFAPTDPGVRRRPNRYGILEPQVPARALRRAPALDLILLPLVGFDDDCHRLGMGGGYYDRSLAFRAHRGRWRRPRLVGLAYDIQKVATLPRAQWDVALDAVVTESGVYLPARAD